MCVDLSLGFLFCSIDLYFCLCARTNNFTICMEIQKTSNSQSDLEKKEWNWRNQPTWLQALLQSHSYQDTEAFLSLLGILWNSAFKMVYLFFSLLPFTSLLFIAICKASSDNHFAFLHFFFLGMVLITASYTISRTSSIVLQALCLSDLIPCIYLSLPLYNCKGFDLGHTQWSSGFPYFLQFKS